MVDEMEENFHSSIGRIGYVFVVLCISIYTCEKLLPKWFAVLKVKCII